MSYIIGLLGMWLFCDGWFSISLYLGERRWDGKVQSWARDHAIRIIRMMIGMFLMIAGGLWIE